MGILALFLVACEGDHAPVSGPDGDGPGLETAAQPHPMNAHPPATAGRSLEGADAAITNGIVSLGVFDEGHLNASGVGLRYEPTSGEALLPGCDCEGWGVADVGTGAFGTASVSNFPFVSNIVVESFTSTASTATSVVIAGGMFRVTHAYAPSAHPNLYRVDVTIENISGTAATDVRYRRAMDWDVPPTEFAEFVTIQGTSGASLPFLKATDDGFTNVNPLSALGQILFTGDAVDSGPADHGAAFDFSFGALAPGASVEFTIFYGAAGTEAGAITALTAVGAEIYSLGQPSSAGGATTGVPNTFIFAFEGVGGTPIGPGPGPGPGPATTCNGQAATPGVQKFTFFGTTLWFGTPGSDVIIGGSGRDVVVGRGGHDTVCTGGGNDSVVTAAGDDWVDLGAGNDVAGTRDGRDMIFGGSGDDRGDCGHTGDTDSEDVHDDEFDGGAGHDHGFLCEIETNVEETGHDH